jgi:hypothetical protein
VGGGEATTVSNVVLVRQTRIAPLGCEHRDISFFFEDFEMQDSFKDY